MKKIKVRGLTSTIYNATLIEDSSELAAEGELTMDGFKFDESRESPEDCEKVLRLYRENAETAYGEPTSYDLYTVITRTRRLWFVAPAVEIKAITIETPNSPEPHQILFYGIDWLYGEWMLTTGGDPVTLKDYEDAMGQTYDEDCRDAIESEINAIEELIATDKGEDITAEQLAYLNEWRETWGL